MAFVTMAVGVERGRTAGAFAFGFLVSNLFIPFLGRAMDRGTPSVTGVLYDFPGRYTEAFWVAIACCAVSAIAIWLAAPRKVRAVAGRTR